MTTEQKVREVIKKKAHEEITDDEATAEIMKIIEEEKRKCTDAQRTA